MGPGREGERRGRAPAPSQTSEGPSPGQGAPTCSHLHQEPGKAGGAPAAAPPCHQEGCFTAPGTGPLCLSSQRRGQPASGSLARAASTRGKAVGQSRREHAGGN